MNAIIARLIIWWRELHAARRRQLDINILWPVIRDRAQTLDMARDAFVVHVSIDDAWKGVSLSEIVRTVEKLN